MSDRPLSTDQVRPTFESPTRRYLQQVLDRHAGDVDGDVADYIPELADADPDRFAIAMVTVDGASYAVGDSLEAFTIQSISKPFVFGAALEEFGDAAVRERVGVEPTGEAFNSITLDPARGTPLNPMVNAGAITCTGLVAEAHPDDPLAALVACLTRYAGRELGVDTDVAASESATGHRNRAIGHLLRSSEALTVDPDVALEAYFGQCSVSVDCRDLATMAATLANGGINPLTGERAASDSTVRSVLSVMATCGMYNGAGEWLYEIGLPAKSGVAGGIIAVQPGQFGVAVFSPRLDRHGNSVRGVLVCEDLSRDLSLHVVQSGNRPPSPVRSAYTLADVGSKRVRSTAERVELMQSGGVALVVELQGELSFSSGEIITRRLVDAASQLEVAVVDFRRVGAMQAPVVDLLVEFADDLLDVGGAVAVSGAAAHPELLARPGRNGSSPFSVFDDLDAALEWAEDRVLADRGWSEDGGLTDAVELLDHPVLVGVHESDLPRLLELLEPRTYEAGDIVFRTGEPADEMLLVCSGRVSMLLEGADGTLRRLATFGGGSLVGEMALLVSEPRAVDVRADTDLVCHAFTNESIDELVSLRPEVRAVLLGNLLRIVSSHAEKLRSELATLAV